jgi:hypothetical protein
VQHKQNEPKKNPETNKTTYRTPAWQQNDTNINTAHGSYNRKAEQQIPSAHQLVRLMRAN